MFTRSQLWILENCKLLGKVFGERYIYLNDDFEYLKIYYFHLPDSWTPNRSTLLIKLPKGENIFSVPPDRFYLQQGLRVHSRFPKHYFECDAYNDKYIEGWARYSFHITKGWKPNVICEHGMNLIGILDALYSRMEEAAKETF